MPDKLSVLIAVLIALSVASERFVEIIKSLVPFLNNRNANPTREGWRTAALQILAVVAGILTALFASPYIPEEICKKSNVWGIFALGLLASGGSGFWNSILTYVGNIKELKKAELKQLQKP